MKAFVGVEEAAAALKCPQKLLLAGTMRGWYNSMILIEDDTRIVFDPESRDAPAMRRAIRKFARATLLQRARDEAWKQEHRKHQAERRRRLDEEEREAARMRTGIVRELAGTGTPRVVAVLDASTMGVEVFVDDPGSAAACLERFDVLAGIWIRDLLWTLRVDPDRFHLANLAAPRGRVAVWGERPIPASPESLVSSTIGLADPLGDPGNTLLLLALGKADAVRDRLERDLGALHAFYRYCAFHGTARFRTRAGEASVFMDWHAPGVRSCYDLVDEAKETARDLDVVTEPVLDSHSLWARAQRCSVRGEKRWTTVIRDRRTNEVVERDDIHAARPAPPP